MGTDGYLGHSDLAPLLVAPSPAPQAAPPGRKALWDTYCRPYHMSLISDFGSAVFQEHLGIHLTDYEYECLVDGGMNNLGAVYKGSVLTPAWRS